MRKQGEGLQDGFGRAVRKSCRGAGGGRSCGEAGGLDLQEEAEVWGSWGGGAQGAVS